MSSLSANLSAFPTLVNGMASVNSTRSGNWSTEAPTLFIWATKPSKESSPPSFSRI